MRALITGASGGIGLATALELSRRGYDVCITGRSETKLAAAKRQLEQNGRGAIEVIAADFSSLAEVRALAARVATAPLHVLINNAGVFHPEFRRSRDGFEDTFAVNHLAPFLLTHLLLPHMRQSGDDVRVVHVSSRLHVQAGQTTTLVGRAVHVMNVMGIRAGSRGARFDFDALDREQGYRGIEAYARSKLAQVVFSNELAKRERHLTSNAVHPGSVASDVTRDNALLYALAPLSRLVLKSPAQGARTSVHVATDASLRGVSGRYFANARAVPDAPVAHDPEVASRLWKLSAERVGLDV